MAAVKKGSSQKRGGRGGAGRAGSSKMKVTVVIPALNEEPNIVAAISECRPYADEIIVVDGHSQDRTVELAKREGARVVMDHARGKGEAIRTVIPHIDTAITVFIDADGSHDARDIPLLVQPLLEGRADHVSGSRLIGGSSELHGTFDEFLRLMGSSLITALINWRFGVALSESQNGFRAIRTDVLRQLDLEEDITTIEQEMIVKTLKKGFRMAEVPAHEHRRRFGDSHISLKKVWFRYGTSLLKYLFL